MRFVGLSAGSPSGLPKRIETGGPNYRNGQDYTGRAYLQ